MLAMKLKQLHSILILGFLSILLVETKAQSTSSCNNGGGTATINSTKRLPPPITGDCTYDVVVSVLNPSGTVGTPFDYTFNYNGDGTIVSVITPSGTMAATSSVTLNSTDPTTLTVTFVVEDVCDPVGMASALVTGSSTAGFPVTIICPTITTTLPVELSLFEGKPMLNENLVQLYWRTNSEWDNEGFEIERSTDTKNWKTLDFVEGYGTSSEIHEYKWYDDAPLALAYYRLKQYDYSGEHEYSHIVAIQKESIKEKTLKVYPNPTTGLFYYELENTELEEVSLQLHDQFGRLVRTWDASSNFINIDDVAAGIYLLTFQNGREQFYQRIIKR